MGRPGLARGRYFRVLFVGYFAGLHSERGIAWRPADSLALRRFLRAGLEAATPDHLLAPVVNLTESVRLSPGVDTTR